MSIHPSLKAMEKYKKQRSVLKRTERLRTMMEKGAWKEGDEVYGLPKIKTVRIKIKKEKIEKAETAVAAAATEGAPAVAENPKPEAPAKGPAKAQEKK